MLTLGRAELYRNAYYSPGGIWSYRMLEDYYLKYFVSGILVIRSKKIDRLLCNHVRLDGDRLECHSIPPQSLGMIFKLPKVVRGIQRRAREADCVVIRLPDPTGYLVAISLLLIGRKFGVEIAGHATLSLEEIWARKGKKHPFVSRMLNLLTRFLVRRSIVASYRSKYLMREYPHPIPDREVVFSGALLKKEFIGRARTLNEVSKTPFQVISIGRINPEKGHEVLLNAFIRALDLTDKAIRLRLIGDGPDRAKLIERVQMYGLADIVEIPGLLPWGDELFATMDDAHLFVLPSLTEGMPRSLIEAMARGMPAIGSNCGGIPELLDEQYLFSPGDVEALASILVNLAEDREKLVKMSSRSFAASRRHWPDELDMLKQRYWDLLIENS